MACPCTLWLPGVQHPQSFYSSSSAPIEKYLPHSSIPRQIKYHRTIEGCGTETFEYSFLFRVRFLGLHRCHPECWLSLCGARHRHCYHIVVCPSSQHSFSGNPRHLVTGETIDTMLIMWVHHLGHNVLILNYISHAGHRLCYKSG